MTKQKNKFSPLTIILCAVLCLYVLSMLGLFYWGTITAFKKPSEFKYFDDPNTYKLPKVWYWNIIDAFDVLSMEVGAGKPDAEFGNILLNSLLYALGCAFFKTLVPCLTAYSCARFNFKSSKVVHSIVLVAMIVPIVGSLPSELAMAYKFKFHDHIWGLWIMSANMLGMYFFVMYSAFKAMPMGYSEAAKIDGASNLQVLLKIGLPLIKNLFFTVFLINFVEFWNNYQSPQVYLPSYPTLGYTLFYQMKSNGNFSETPQLIALAIIVFAPVLLLFLIFQEKLMGNLTLGGLKG